ncbi:MAG: sulfotransferase domain-containing protein [Candidatus Gracilibacteria bacterium]
MALKLIVNGYFRSGTSIVWKILKDSNNDYTVFYEPCHEALFDLVSDYEKSSNKKNTLHGMDIWEEYTKNPDFFNKLRFIHPNILKPVPVNYSKIKNYVNAFNELDENTILQTNRWHLFLDFLGKDFDCEIIHIIRNPIDVYNSIINKAFEKNQYIKKIIYKNRSFNINIWYQELSKFYPELYQNRLYNSKYNLLFPFEMFIVVWVLTNYYALLKLNKRNIIIYEKLLYSPDEYKKKIEKLGFKFEYKKILKENKKEIEKWEQIENNKEIKHIVKKFCLQDKYDFIVFILKENMSNVL